MLRAKDTRITGYHPLLPAATLLEELPLGAEAAVAVARGPRRDPGRARRAHHLFQLPALSSATSRIAGRCGW